MSNCAFWSETGELVAVHGESASDPAASFGPWAKVYRLTPGRLVTLSRAFPRLEAPGPGWHLTVDKPRSPRPRAVPIGAPVAVAAPALDKAATFLLPHRFAHEQFTLTAWPTWVTTARPETEIPEGWFAALDANKTNRFLVRLVPHRDRLPGHGWRNMLAWVLKEHARVRLVPLNGLPTPAALNAAPAWEYRVEAGQEGEAAAWDVQLLPARGLLAEWAPGINDPWEATALLRWMRPGAGATDAPEPTWAGLLSRLPTADARLLVQNVLTTMPGGAASAAPLFFQSLVLSSAGKTLVRHVPDEGLPLSLLSTLFGRRAWHEIERARRQPPSDGERRRLRDESLADLELRLTEGRLSWSPEALALWESVYRAPKAQAEQAELDRRRAEVRWSDVLSGDPRVPEYLLRRLDVTDAALCLRDAPDLRWRRFVTARREAELREELAFCKVWEARGELTVERVLDAWRQWDRLLGEVPLTGGDAPD
jgi:hypothetical protein